MSLGATRTITIAAVRYLDSFIKDDGGWLIRQRQVIVDSTQRRALITG
jgi:hypothetical protein